MPRIREDVLSQVWRQAHVVGARHQLSGVQFAALRMFAAQRMRELPHTVVDGSRGDAMRPTFVDALDHAARDIAGGNTPK